MSVRTLRAGLLALACAALAPRAAWSQDAAAAARRAVRLSFNGGAQFRPGADAQFSFAFPTKTARFTLLRVDPDRLVQRMLDQGREDVEVGDSAVVRTWTESAGKENPDQFNRAVTLKAPEPGFYVLEGRWGQQPQEAQYQPFLVTDVALLLKRGPDRMAVWVVDPNTGQPRRDAVVHARFPKVPVRETRTGADGLAMLDLDPARHAGAFCVVSALAGKGWAAIASGAPGAGAAAQDRTVLWTERALYAPGDRWQARGMARSAAGKPLAGVDLKVMLMDPSRKVVHQRVLKTDAFGAFEDAGDLDAGLPPGAYHAVAEIHNRQTWAAFSLLPTGLSSPFQVRIGGLGDGRPGTGDRGSPSPVSGLPSQPSTINHQPSTAFTVEARQRLGEPIRKGRVSYRVYQGLRQGGMVPAGLERYGWLVGEPPVSFQFWNPLDRGRTVTDDAGTAVLQLDPAKVPAGQPYLLAVTVTDRHGRSVETSRYVDSPSHPDAGAPTGPVAPAAPAVRAGRGRRAVPAPEAPTPPDGLLTLAPDRLEYRLGDTARLRVQCGMEGVRALLTLEGSRLYSARVLHLKKGMQEILVPLRDPRMQLLHADLIALASDGTPHRAARLLLVEPERQSLRVTLAPPVLRDGEVETEVLTTDASGKPVPARVFAGLEARPGGSLPDGADLRRALAPPELNDVQTLSRPWGLSALDLLPWLRTPSGSSGFWVPGSGLITVGELTRNTELGTRNAILTGADGRARIRLPYAGSLEDLRLVARAAGKSGVGQAGLALATSSPVTVRLHVPARFFQGDVATARAEVRNDSGTPRQVTLRASADGLDALWSKPQTLNVPPHGSAWADLPLKAGKPGRHALHASIEAGKTRAADQAGITVTWDAAIPGDLAPVRALSRITVGPLGSAKYEVQTRNAGHGARNAELKTPTHPSTHTPTPNLAPGDELEVTLTLPAGAKEAGVRVVEPLGDGLALVKAEAPAGAKLRRTETGLECEWKEAPQAEDRITYRLRALSPGTWSLGRTALYRGRQALGSAEPVRLAVLALPAPKLLAADRDGERLRLRYELRKEFAGALSGTLTAGIRDARGVLVAQGSEPVTFDAAAGTREVTLSLPLVAPEQVKGATVLATLEGNGALALGSAEAPLAGIESRSELSLMQAAGQPMTRVLGQTDLVRGAPASIRVIALNSRGAVPVEGAKVRVLFHGSGTGDRGPGTGEARLPSPVSRPNHQPSTRILAEGKTDARGTLEARFVVPADLVGEGKLVVECASPLGEERVERAAKIEDRLQMMLSTDKPIYQPGQLIRIRSLTLRKPGLDPLAETPVTIEVADPKGNKVFKQRAKSSAFGVAAAEFQLADEVNLGSYTLRAIAQPDGQPPLTVEKTLEIKKYVLPKFKIEISTERPYYLPGERLKGTMKVAYFFGKPVANGDVELKLSTFVTKFEEFAQIKGKTNAQGELTFEQDLPKLFVGQPLQAGNAVVMLEGAVTDTAQHRETRNHSVTVSANPINVALIPESGTLVPGLENRVYVAANYPDGRPAKGARFRLAGPGLPEKGLEGQADDHGMAQVLLTPQPAGPTLLAKLQVEASDEKGNHTKQEVSIRAGARQDGVLLRADKAIYEVGEQARLDVRSTTPRGTVYLDVVRNRQTVLTRTVDLEAGRGSLTVPLGEDTAGTLEFRAYRILPSGETARDTRIAYVNPANELNIGISTDKETYTPGAPASLAFHVTDAQGHPVMAALGVNIVDESVFALQELQPGLEKVYFTLEKELLEPRYEIHWDSPGTGIFDNRDRGRPDAERQALARTMFAAVEMAHDYSLDASTQDDRASAATRGAERLRDALQNAVHQGQFQAERDAYFTRYHELPEEREGLAYYSGEKRPIKSEELRDAWDQPYALRMLEPEPTTQQVPFEVVSAGPDGELDTADDLRVEGAVNWWSYVPNSARQPAMNEWAENRLGERGQMLGEEQLRGLGSVAGFANGPMGMPMGDRFRFGGMAMGGAGGFGGGMPGPPGQVRRFAELADAAAPQDLFFKAAGRKAEAPASGATEPAVTPVRVRDYFPETLYSNPSLVTDAEGKAKVELTTADSITTWRITALANSRAGDLGSVTAPLRVFQDFFVDLDLPVALTQGDEVQLPVAIYNYLPGPQRVRLRLQLGDEDAPQGSGFGVQGSGKAGSSGPSQNLPGSPVASSKAQASGKPGSSEPRTLNPEPSPGPWFEMVGGDATEKFVNLERDQVSVVHFRIKAKTPGVHRFTVMAYGTKMSDAVRRQVEVSPDGKEFRQTVNDRLDKSASATVTIPAEAIPGSAKILVKVYPGVFSQVVEGLDSIFRMPNGCFEQTTSVTYPNVLVMDYLKQSKKINPAVQMKAEEYINIGMQKLLTFQAPDGGFSLWADGQPETFLTAFAIMESFDMSKVHEVDPEVIRRAQRWLIAKQTADGSWPVTPTAHQERASTHGVFAFTAYATWSLAETAKGGKGGTPVPVEGLDAAVQKGARYLKDHLDDAKDPYLLALVANALTALDPQDAVTRRVVQALAGQAREDDKAAWWGSAEGAVFTEARGKTADLETTSLAAYALIRSRSHGALVNKALTFLIRSKDSYGTWGSTQPTVLALKALIASMGASLEDNQGTVTVLLNGKEVQKLAITPENSDVLQQVDLGSATQTGANRIELRVDGAVSALYQVVGRYYVPWDRAAADPKEKGPLDIQVLYDRSDLKTDDTITASVKLQYTGEQPTGQVMVELGIPPGFQVQADDLAEARGSGLIKRYDVTGRQVLVYLDAMQRGKPVQFNYRLRARFPIRAKTPRSTAYDYYTPDLQAVAKPVELVVR